jgi:hypothetical protein
MPVQFCSPYWTSFELTSTSTRSRRYLHSLPFEGAVRVGSVSPGQQKASAWAAIPVLIEGAIPLPPRSVCEVKALSRGSIQASTRPRGRSARLASASRSTVLEALDRFGIPLNGNGHKRTGHLPFGFDYINHKLVKNGAEQAAIRIMRQYRAGGLSLREIAGNLNQKLISTKQNGIWQANTVREILGSCMRLLVFRLERATGGVLRESVGADCGRTRPTVHVGALILEEGQRPAARTPRVSGPGGRGSEEEPGNHGMALQRSWIKLCLNGDPPRRKGYDE